MIKKKLSSEIIRKRARSKSTQLFYISLGVTDRASWRSNNNRVTAQPPPVHRDRCSQVAQLKFRAYKRLLVSNVVFKRKKTTTFAPPASVSRLDYRLIIIMITNRDVKSVSVTRAT